MATTSAEITASVLDSMSEAGVEYAILHGTEAVEKRTVKSDIDLVAGIDPALVMRRAAPYLAAKGLNTIMVWTYDVASASVFVVDETASDGAQLDIVSDRSGLGAYGIIADQILAAATTESSWPRACAEHELLYLILKRQIKAQDDRLRRLVQDAAARPHAQLREAANSGFSTHAAARIMAAIEGREPTASRMWMVRRSIAEVRRIGDRLARPVGRWVHAESANGEPVCVAITERLSQILPVARSMQMSGGPISSSAEVRSVASTRFRAGVLASWGRPPSVIQPDVTLDGARLADEEIALRHVVTELARPHR